MGAALWLGSEDETVRSLSAGAVASAGGQFTSLILDEEDAKTKAQTQPPTPPTPPTDSTPPKPSNAEGLPPGALEAAYERARRKLAMAREYDAAQ